MGEVCQRGEWKRVEGGRGGREIEKRDGQSRSSPVHKEVLKAKDIQNG